VGANRTGPSQEEAIQTRGRALLASVEPERALTLTPAWWQEKLMAWATSDPDFRVKLLRFVDVLPSLHTRGAVADHVRQYFRSDAPWAVRVGTAVAGTRAFRPVLSQVVRQGVFAMAERFIGGAGPAEALPRLRNLTDAGTAYTVDLLGEAILSEDEADVYAARYLALIEALSPLNESHAAGVVQPNVSVKLSALTSHFQPAAPDASAEAVSRRLVPLLRAARERQMFVNVDMEQYRFKDLTLTIFEKVLGSLEFASWTDVGIVVQAYLRDAETDLARLRALARSRGASITVRLVKGAYWDEEVVLARQENRPSPVFEEKAATDASYERCTQALLDAFPDLLPAFGTHNPRSIAQAVVKAEASHLAANDLEFQMLFGMAEGLRHAVYQAGYRTRVYVPIGEVLPGMAYLVRRLLENTSNESWLLQPQEHGRLDELLKPPWTNESPRPAADGFANAGPAEFYRPEVRNEMRRALERARASFPRHCAPLISGEELEDPEPQTICYPAEPRLVVAEVTGARIQDVERAVGDAHNAFPAWRDAAATERAAKLRRAADLLENRRFDFAATMVYECAKPWAEADGDVIEAIDYLRYYAGEAERLAAGVPLNQVPGEDDRYTYEGRGVVVAIAPWNFPLAILCGMTTAALAVGCSVIVKPAEQSPLVASDFVRLLHEAGVPATVLHYLPGAGEVVGKALVEHPGVDAIAFTGSNAVGLEIVAATSAVRPGQRNVKHVIAEMGGKNAIIVDDDADLDQAVSGVIVSAFGFAGQKCSACSRVIVLRSAYDEFRRRLAAAVDSLVVGAADDPFTDLSAVISREAKERILEYSGIGEREGSLLVRGSVPTDGYFVAPTVFENVPLTSRLAQEEVFGPVLLLFRAETFAHALAVALDSPFALTGGIFSRNPRNIALARREFRVGNLYINRKITGAVVGRQPFGGSAMSGLGDKAGGPDYLLQFMVPRVVTENTMRRGFAPD
jgi:RHH-type transcriptional regulator, proline utilization regulon repressor / proline dehydrogenase / delta 1-pyrroline-5-carboxylate dehydrogenase